MTPLTRKELAILRSVVYASLFDYPLTADQARRTLVECEGTAPDVLAAYGRSHALNAVIEYRDGFFYPVGCGHLVAERRRREGRSRAFLERHARVLRLISGLPFVRMVALSGSIAHLNLEPEGDLDLFIVTRGHHVWTVTLSILLLTKLLGHRRTICANFVVADTELAFEQQDLFTANQIIHLKPIVGADVMDELLAANPFVGRFYPNAVDRADDGLDRGRRSRPAGLIERACRGLYGWYLRRKARSWRSPEQVRLGDDCLKLHTRSHRAAITDRFEGAVARAVALAASADDQARRAIPSEPAEDRFGAAEAAAAGSRRAR
ncbi:MAG TPA: hypothetical protein VEU08_16210 [Vicinamibacterales bacterium]|nr:hypothetical protein [Vicinamibacterales bacterium]